MSDFRTKTSFEKAFRKAVTNFDETKIWFEHPSKSYNQSKVCFVLDGKLRKFPMYKSQFELDHWANHFIDFLNTGNFDYNGYWRIYGDFGEIGEVLKFPLCDQLGNYFYEHSDEMSNYLDDYRKKYGDCGIRLVSKPLNNENSNSRICR